MLDSVPVVVGWLTLALLFASVLAWGYLANRAASGQPPLEFEPRIGAPWAGVDVLVLATAFLAIEIVAFVVTKRVYGELPHGVTPTTLVAESLVRVVWLVSAVVYLRLRGAYARDLGWDLAHLRGDFRLGGLLFLSALLPVYAVQYVVTRLATTPSDHPLLKMTREFDGVWVLALATVVTVVLAPVFEEFVFRVLLQGWLESEQARLRERRSATDSARPGFAPLVICSLLFAALHQWPDPIAIFVLSLFLGYAYRQTHRFLPSLVIHAGVNGWTMLNVWLLYLSGQSPTPS